MTMPSITGAAIPDWYEGAICAQTDPEAFFPKKGGTTTAAKKVCASCPVRSQCLDWALDTVELWGVWGGTTRLERRKLRKDAA
ncbi:MAG TPA: WhiB family transcriptional regulator [Mycobacterium sp.]